MKARPGFTIIELVGVILLTGLAAALATPAMMPEVEYPPAERAARAIATELERARTHALRDAVAVRVVIDPAEATVRADALEPAGIRSLFAKQLKLPFGVRIESYEPRIEIVFHPGGAATGDAVLATADGEEAIVRVDALTGVIRVL